MSYSVKRTLVSLITELIVLIAYIVYAFDKHQAGAIGSSDLKAWAGVGLVFIGISIFVNVVIQIVFHIYLSVSIAVRETVKNNNCKNEAIEKSIKAEIVTDEMDRLIRQKSIQFGFTIAGFGFIGALLTQVLGYAPAMLLHVLLISFYLGSLVEGVVQLYYYKRGL